MRYAVLGTGVVGRTIATRLVSLGHEVTIGTRDPETTLARTEPDGYGNPPFAAWQEAQPAVTPGDVRRRGRRGPRSSSTPPPAAPRWRRSTAAGADNLAGKLLVDIANPLDFSQGMPPSLDPVNTDSLGEQIQRAFPAARVVKTLNTMNAAVMVEPGRRRAASTPSSSSGDDAQAKEQATALLVEMGWPRTSSSTSATSRPPAAPRCCCRSGCGSGARSARGLQLPHPGRLSPEGRGQRALVPPPTPDPEPGDGGSCLTPLVQRS